MATSQRQWGVTPPISQSLPTDSELLANDALIEELKKQNNFESHDETERRLELHSPREDLADPRTQENRPPTLTENHG